jgi:hypothetical protein
MFLTLAGITGLWSFVISQENSIHYFETNNQSTVTINDYTNWKSADVKTSFELNGILDESYSVTVDCKMKTKDFVQNNPSTINVSLSFPVTCWMDLDIAFIHVQPVNALFGFPNYNSTTYIPMEFSDFYLCETDVIGADQVWMGSDGFAFPILFQDSGLIKLKIEIYSIPSQFTVNVINSTRPLDSSVLSRYQNFDKSFGTIVTLPINIESSQSVAFRESQEFWQDAMLNQQEQIQKQQEIDGAWNLTLTLFIISLTIFQLAIAMRGTNSNNQLNQTSNNNTNDEDDSEEVNYIY